MNLTVRKLGPRRWVIDRDGKRYITTTYPTRAAALDRLIAEVAWLGVSFTINAKVVNYGRSVGHGGIRARTHVVR